VSIGGDIHSSAVTDLKLDYASTDAPLVGTEFIGPSITSLERLPQGFVEGTLTNPHIHYYDTQQHGYLLLEATSTDLRAYYRYVSDILDPDATIATGSSWFVPAGTVGAQRA
jgi:alkaline phosphatase D